MMLQMDNFKYSVRTQQFGKRKHPIFIAPDRDPNSLEVHDPSSGLILTEDNSKEYSINTSINPKVQPQANTSLNVSRPSHSPTSRVNLSNFVKAKANHPTSTTAQVRVPSLSPARTLPPGNSVDMQQLQAVKLTLYRNEQMLRNLSDSVNSICQQAISLYSMHEAKLKEIVNRRCCEVVRVFRRALQHLRSEEEGVKDLDCRVTVLLNTLKDSRETLRLVKIKQECIEALQKQHAGLSRFNEQVYQRPTTRETTNRPIRVATEGAMEEFQEFNTKPRTNSEISIELQQGLYYEKRPNANSGQLDSVENFFSQMPPISESFRKDEKKSPFQASDLLLSNKKAHNNIKEAEYSFRRGRDMHFGLDELPPMPAYRTEAMKQKRRLDSEFTQQKSIGVDPSLLSLLNSLPSKQVWLDDLNCLRRRNGTYILDQQGNAIICSSVQFHRLVELGAVVTFSK